MFVAVEQDVRGFDITVDEPSLMRRAEREGHLASNVNREHGRQAALIFQQSAEIASIDVAHRKVDLVIRLPRVVHRKHVGVVERSRELRLADEPLLELRVGIATRCNHFERDLSVEPHLGGEVDDAHAALGQQRPDPVAGQFSAALEDAAASQRFWILTTPIAES